MEYNKKVTYWKHKQEIQLYNSPIEFGRIVNGAEQEEPLSGFQTGKARTNYNKMDLRDRIASDKRRKSYYEKRIHYLADMAIHNELATFITLTFADTVTDYGTAQHEWDLFLKRIKYKVGLGFKYIAVHELQKKRGGVFHFHFLCNLGYYPVKELETIWKKGFVYIEQIKGDNQADRIRQVMYSFKYITKDIMDESKKRVRNTERKIYCSRNLDRPKVEKELSGDTAENIIFANMEHVIDSGSYDMKNYLGEKINEVDYIKIRREE